MLSLKKFRSSGHVRSALRVTAIAALMIPVAGLLWQTSASATDRAVTLPAPNVQSPAPAQAGLETAVLAGGCFWGMETVYQHINGVTNVVSGYSGGNKNSVDYETVSTGTTGNAESIKITFDPRKISYGKLLQIYFSVAHNPTELNRQGPDSGTQYRSNIFYANPAQEKVAKAYIAQLNKAHVFDRPIVTRVDPLTGFYPAEGYHQNFADRHPNNLYIVINDAPKVKHLHRLFPDIYRSQPVIVAAQ